MLMHLPARPVSMYPIIPIVNDRMHTLGACLRVLGRDGVQQHR